MNRELPTCGLGRPITDKRIELYSDMIHFLIHKHFPALIFPAIFEYEDIVNQSRLEVFKAIKKLDPVKALECYIKDPIKRAKKLAEKAADPEKAYASAEKNLVFWAIDNHLKRVKWNYGHRTASKKRRGVTLSIEAFLINRENGDRTKRFTDGIGYCEPNFTSLSESCLSPAKKQDAQALCESLMWIFRYRGAAKAKNFFQAMSKKHRELVTGHLHHLIDQKNDIKNLPTIQLVQESESEL